MVYATDSKSVPRKGLRGSSPSAAPKILPEWEYFCAAGAGQLLGLRRDENAGAICRHQSAWRGGGQAEGSDDDPRAEAESLPRHRIYLRSGFLTSLIY